MTPSGARTQRCSGADARIRLGQAEKFLEVAELVAGEAAEEAFSVSAALAVLAGIAAADAACCAAIGRRSRTQDHHDAEALVEQITPGGRDAAKRLRKLIDLKDAAHYGLINVTRQRLTAAIRQANGLVEFATATIGR
jgi:hypothetical protein